MKSLVLIRSQVSPIVDINFLISAGSTDAKYSDEQLATTIKGANYTRTKQKIADFVERCNQTLAGFKERVNQSEQEYESIVGRSKSENPGSGPASFFVDRSDPNSVAKYNEKVNRYNNKLELYRRLCDQAERAKERYEEAVSRYSEKKADLDEQIRQRNEDLTPALDQDILAFLGKMQQLAYDNIYNKRQFFEGFAVIFMAKKAYAFFYDRINSTADQRAASDIFKKLEDELDGIVSNSHSDIITGLHSVAEFLFLCFSENKTIFASMHDDLKRLPYKECKDNEQKMKSLLSLPIETNFEFESIVDPLELARVEQQVQIKKSDFEQQIRNISDLIEKLGSVFELIGQVRKISDEKLVLMGDHKKEKIAGVLPDILFVLSVFNGFEQDEYLRKHKNWLEQVERNIEEKLGVEIEGVAQEVIKTDLFIKSATDLINKDAAFNFLNYREKLIAKKQEFEQAVLSLEATLEKINRLPKEKSEEFRKKMSTLLNVSIIPLGNIGILFSINDMIKKFLPALISDNTFYSSLRKLLIKKFQISLYIHIALMVISGGISFAVQPNIRPILYGLAGSYLISTLVILLKGIQFKKLKG